MIGIDLAWSANIANYIREFDLVTIGEDADISGDLIPRIITKDGVIMHKIKIGAAAKIDIKAIVTPNVIVEDGATVDKCEICQSGVTVKTPSVDPRVPDAAASNRLQWYQTILNLACGV